MHSQPRREHLIETAAALFNEHGYHATGIDTIMQVSGVSKTTLYKYFSSKEELILEVLRRRHEESMQYFRDYVDRSKQSCPDSQEERHILAVFDALHDLINSDHFYGCNFINASAEYNDSGDAINAVAASHKKALSQFITGLLTEKSSAKRKGLADQVLIILDGAIISAQVRHDKKAAQKAKQAVRKLLGLDE